MRFVEKYECTCLGLDDKAFSLGLYDTYEEAKDHGLLQASTNLPKESIKAFRIDKLFINIPVWSNPNPLKRGD